MGTENQWYLYKINLFERSNDKVNFKMKGKGYILKKIVENINKKTTSKILVNILYAAISMLIGFIFALISITINGCGIRFAGKNFSTFLIQGFIVFSIIFFIKFKSIEKDQKMK